jgi:hypothetical protein
MTVTANRTIDIPPIQILLFIFQLPLNFPLLTIFVGHPKLLCPPGCVSESGGANRFDVGGGNQPKGSQGSSFD